MKRIYLRPIEDSDTANIVRWRNSDAVRKNLIDQTLITEQSHREHLEKYVFTKQRYQFIICVRDADVDMDIGSCFVKDIDHDTGKAEIGLFIGEDAVRGKGYAKYVMSELLDFCFFQLKSETIVLWVLESNTIARKVYTQTGFLEREKNDEGFIRMELHKNLFCAIGD